MVLKFFPNKSKESEISNNTKNIVATMFTDQGVFYSVESKSVSDWLNSPNVFASDSETVSFLGQLEEEGYVDILNDGVLLPWKSLYHLMDSSDYSTSIPLLRLPENSPWRPILASRNSFTDQNFSISLAGWVDASGRQLPDNYKIEGAILSSGSKNRLLSQASWEVVRAIAAFHKQPPEERNPESNRLAWAHIRNSAIKAEAELSDFLKKTMVLTPEKLKLDLRKVDFGEIKTVEVIPTFLDAPARWMELFDRLSQVQERYEIPDGQGLVHVIISDAAKTVLKEIKNMPGRRVAGERAEAFVRNPFAVLGPDAHQVLDSGEFDQSRENAGISFARFTAKILRDKQGYPIEVSILIEETLQGEICSEAYKFKGAEDLERFLKKIEGRIERGAQCCFWEGFDLEILGDTPDQVLLLKDALENLRRPEKFTHADIFDLSGYSERIECFGVEKPYYSPFIARKNDGDSWFPENVEFGLWYTPEGAEEPIAVALNEEMLGRFSEKLKEAIAEGKESFDFPGFPKPIKVAEAENIISVLGEAAKDVRDGTFDEKKLRGTKPVGERKGLVVKPNIESLDYSESCGSLSCPDDLKPRLPDALKQEVSLKDHQLRGVAWLQHLWSLSPKFCRGAVLADDMGLGKTLQLLAFIAKCLEKNPSLEPILVVAPVSLLDNWKEEVEKFFKPGILSLLTLYGSALSEKRLPREAINEDLQANGVTRMLKKNWLGDAKIVLTTYETLRDLEFSLAAQKWSIMVCDEAQKIKNPNAMVTRAAKKQNVQFKIACTGTPVENTLTDLWCLFDFVQAGLLGALNDFGGRYRKPIEAETDEEKERVKELRTIINPQILRREKKDVAKDLPRKVIVDECRTLPISQRQRQLYAHAISLFRSKKGDDGKAPLNHLGLLQHLRRICSDPRPIGHIGTDHVPVSEIMTYSPKMSWMIQVLAEIRNKGEKVIIFCELRDLQRTLSLCIAEHFGFAPEIINGETSVCSSKTTSRQKRLKAFQNKSGFGVIILSPLAVGFGVNIQAANHVIHFTRMWNPAKEDQATDRSYRIGQAKDVFVYYPVIVAHDFTTFDAKLDKLLEWKRGLSADMLNGTGDLTPTAFGDLEDVDGSSAFGNDFVVADDIKEFSPEAFEAFCAILWAKHGYSKAYRTPRSGDGGVDVVAINGKKGMLIQCKTSAQVGKELGWEAVKDVVTGAAAYAIRHPSISFSKLAVTNQFFNAGARHHANLNHVELVDRSQLEKMIADKPVKHLELERFLFNTFEEG